MSGIASEQVDEITSMVVAASEKALHWFRKLEAVENKLEHGFDPVTEADKAIETEIRSNLREMFPDDMISGEEFGVEGEGPRCWTIDPIDGTGAFVAGQPMWGTLVGLTVGDAAVAGWMHLPVTDETFVGHSGTTTLSYGKSSKVGSGEHKLRVSSVTEISEATVLSTTPAMFASGAEAQGYGRLLDAAKTNRYSGDCVNYALLCMGLTDLVVENQLKVHDIVPLLALIEGAGGVVTNLEGKTPLDGGYVVAAATAELHETALQLLRS